MSFGERDAITSLLTVLIVTVMVYVSISGQYALGKFDGPDALKLWAWSVLWVLGYGIGIAIAIPMLFTVAYGIITGEKKPSDLRDERDRLIEHRGTRIGAALTSLCIVGAVADLAWGSTALHAFNVLLISCPLSEIVKNLFKVVCYRRGF